MATKKSLPIDIHDASQLANLAYQKQTRAVFNWETIVKRLRSARSKEIAAVIVGDDADAGDETLRQANYYIKWAEATAKTAQEAGRRSRR